MTEQLDGTHDPALRSWVASANSHPDFPIQNLPFGVVARQDGTAVPAVAIGDVALDLAAAHQAGLLSEEAGRWVEATRDGTLNGALALGAGPRRALRAGVSALLAEGSPDRARVEPHLVHSAPRLPVRIGDYTDFYVGIHHATAIGKLFRPDNPLLPNYKHVPIGYHGRASSVVPSGQPIRRPRGQTRVPDAAEPSFGPAGRLDYELELGIWVGEANALGQPVSIGEAAERIAGFCLLNDWSARDIQAWEYQPLGPFLAKNFASTVSTWIVTPEALAPFRAPASERAEGDPRPLRYLTDAADAKSGGLAVELEVLLSTQAMRVERLSPHQVSRSDTRYMYWTPAQLVAHHTCGGCNLQPGDLLGTGTISGPDLASTGSLIEATQGGKVPIRLPTGEDRRFLEDGDEVILTAHCRRDGFVSIGFGECRATVLPSP